MGRVLGYPKLKVNFNNVSDKDLMIYCKRDTEIIYKTMLNLFEFIKKHDLGAFGYTAPSISFK